MNFLRRLFRRPPHPIVLGLLQKNQELESRIHHLEVQNRDLLARVGAMERDMAWILRPDEQPLPAATDLPEGVTFRHTK